jgi:UDP-N-acetyl-D-mannosaminuronic acid transferase (WecB/TagA/CpsF family)
LPTPKQEYLANLISQKKNYKIICIGGALAMATGEEKSVPEKFENILGFEAIWRLKTDTIRRSKRLLFTLFFFILGEISGFYKSIKGKIVVK